MITPQGTRAQRPKGETTMTNHRIFFETELKTAASAINKDYKRTTTGRALFITLNDNRRAKLEFMTGIQHERYTQLKVTILSTTEGAIDCQTFVLSDFSERGACIDANFDMPRWSETPTARERRSLAVAIADYIGVFE